MANRSHVPKFGNWEKDNIPYTSYFDNARKGKAGVKMNPNDPEENPEAFMMITSGGGLDSSDGDYRPIQADSDKSYNSMEKRLTVVGNTYYHDQRSGRNSKSISSEFSSDLRSNSDRPLQQPGHRRLNSDLKKGPGEGSNSFSPSVQGHSRQRSGSYPSNESMSDYRMKYQTPYLGKINQHCKHQRAAASVPKFGAWDEADPPSGEGFTVIFNKVKEEKQIASAKFPTVPAQVNSSPRTINGASSSRSKICCCLSSSTSD